MARQRRTREHPGRDPRRGRERAHRPGRGRRRARAGCPGRVPRPARRGQERAVRDGMGAGQTAAHPVRCCLPVLRHRALSRTGRSARAGWPRACRSPMSCRRGARRREHGNPACGNREHASPECGSWTGGRAQTGRRSRTGARFRPRKDPGTRPGWPARYRRGTPRAGRTARELPPGRSLPCWRGPSRSRLGGQAAPRRAPGPVTGAHPGCAARARCRGGQQTCQPAGPCLRHRRPGPPPSVPHRHHRHRRARPHRRARQHRRRARPHRRARQHRTGPGRTRRHGHAQHRWGVPGPGPRREPCSGRVPRRRNGRRPGPARLPRSLLRSSSLMATMAPRLTGRPRGRSRAFRDLPAGTPPRKPRSRKP